VIPVWDQYCLDDVRNDRYEQDVSRVECGAGDDVSAKGIGFRGGRSFGAFREESGTGGIGSEEDHGSVQREPGLPAVPSGHDNGFNPVRVYAEDLLIAANRGGVRATSRLYGRDWNAAAGFSDNQRISEAAFERTQGVISAGTEAMPESRNGETGACGIGRDANLGERSERSDADVRSNEEDRTRVG